MTKSFLDIPVYRIDETEYYRRRKSFAHAGLTPMLEGLGDEASNPKHKAMIDDAREHLHDVYGGIWRFNEIIGYIRLHFLGTQVRGEYFAAGNKRVVKTRTKRFTWRTHKLAMEQDIEHPLSDSSILAAVRKYLARCQIKLSGRYVDIERFEILAAHIRWYDLWAIENPFSPNSPPQPELPANR